MLIFTKLEGKRKVSNYEVFEFLKEEGLLKDKLKCEKCNLDMKLQVYRTHKDVLI